MLEYLPMDKNDSLAKKIKKARFLAGMSQKDLAQKLGFSDKTISAYETGRAVPPVPTLEKIASLTNKPVEDFMNGRTKSSSEIESINKKLDLILEKMMEIYVGVVLLDDKERIFLIRENDKNMIGKGRWNLPGGSVDSGESLVEAISRETKEETGYGVEVESLLGCYKCKKSDKSWIYTVFGARVVGKKIRCEDPDVKEGKWFEKNEFLDMNVNDLVHPDMQLVYQIFINSKGLEVKSVKYIDYS